MSIAEIMRQEARLIIMRELAAQASYSLNETLLQDTLATFGIFKPRDWVREELRRLEDLGAVTIRIAGTVMIAVATPKGLDHAKGNLVIEGIKRPSPEA